MTEKNGGHGGNGIDREIPAAATEDAGFGENSFIKQPQPGVPSPAPVAAPAAVSAPPDEPVELTEEQKKKKRLKTIAWIVALLLLLFWGAYITYKYMELRNMEPRIYVENDNKWTGWYGLDHNIEEGTVRISRVRYVAPNLHYYFELDEISELQEVAVLKVEMQLDRFINSVFSLLTIFSPAGNVSVIVDKQGRIGLVGGPEGEPEWSERRIQLERPYDLYLFLDQPNNQVSAYIGGRDDRFGLRKLIEKIPFLNERFGNRVGVTNVVSIDRNFTVYPLQDVWLGCVWIGGNNDFGAPLGYEIYGFAVGDEDLIIANYSLAELLRALLRDNVWLWIPPILAILIILVLLVIRFIVKRKKKREEAGKLAEEAVSA